MVGHASHLVLLRGIIQPICVSREIGAIGKADQSVIHALDVLRYTRGRHEAIGPWTSP